MSGSGEARHGGVRCGGHGGVRFGEVSYGMAVEAALGGVGHGSAGSVLTQSRYGGVGSGKARSGTARYGGHG